MVHPIVEHIATRPLAYELDRNFVILACPHVLDVALSVFLNICGDLSWCTSVARVIRILVQLRDTNAFLHVSHLLKINAIVDEGELSSVKHLFFHSQSHVGLAKPRVHFLPVKMFLINDGFDSLW